MSIQPVQLLDVAYGTDLERVDPTEAVALEARGALVRHPTRSRPLYFDGRFLSADDLTADQDYARVRQAELGRLLGPGVVEGLGVGTIGASRTRLRVGAGLGLTAFGEVVTLDRDAEVDVADLTQIEQLDVELGLRVLPSTPVTGLQGLYVLALRAVEFSANKIAAYPTKLTGPRTVEDGEVVEAVVLTLIPWSDRGSASTRRARVARELFVTGVSGGIPVGALPIAMLTLDAGSVAEIDTWLVRREVGAERGGLYGFGLTQRALAEAYLRQYGEHLRAEVSRRLPNTIRTAADHFQALPPVGQLPKDTVDGTALNQRFFPPEVRTSIALIPEDELASLVEDRLLLPPIDLQAPPEVLGGVAVDILIPVPRAELKAKLALLDAAARAALAAAAPRQLQRTSPLQTLQALRARRFVPAVLEGEGQVPAPWATLLGAAPSLIWYARRPTFRASDLHLADRLFFPERPPGEPTVVTETVTVTQTVTVPPPDRDEDGLSDELEARLGTDPRRPDTDNDGLTDLEELVRGTDPRTEDSDRGGVPDGVELRRGTNPLNAADDERVPVPIDRLRRAKIKPDTGDTFEIETALDEQTFETQLDGLLANDALADNAALRAALFADLKTGGVLDERQWRGLQARYSRPGAGSGLEQGLKMLGPDPDRIARLLETGIGGALDEALSRLDGSSRKEVRALLKQWVEGTVNDAELRAGVTRVAQGGTP
jgi:hypothetical protein